MLQVSCKESRQGQYLMILQESVKYEDALLTTHCLEYLEPIACEVVDTETFLELDLHSLKVILSSDNLQISEIKLFLALQRW